MVEPLVLPPDVLLPEVEPLVLPEVEPDVEPIEPEVEPEVLMPEFDVEPPRRDLPEAP